MKNAIMYYYNLTPTNICLKDKMYKFNINNDYYVFMKIKMDINEIQNVYYLSSYLLQRGIYNHKIILNNSNYTVTTLNNDNYVLLKIYDTMDQKIKFDDILVYSNLTSNINYDISNTSWYNMWINKLDYFEYQMDNLKKKFPLLNDSFYFFSGLTETAISLIINMKINYSKYCICHKRIKKNYTLFDIYNPFNFVIDYKIRDSAEYFKELFLADDSYNSIEKYIMENDLSIDELKLFFIRILYPSFYFDLVEEVIMNKVSEEKIKKILEKAEDYEKLLKKTYTLIKSICGLPEIEWLN